MKRRYILLAFWIILLVGLGLRMFHLDQESIWVDEAYSLRYAMQDSPLSVIKAVSMTEGAPPGHYLLLHYWINLFGNSEFSVRFPSLLFGFLSIPLMFAIGRRMKGTKVGLLAALFMATSMLQVLYSQEARLYAMYGFFSLLGGYFLLRLLQNKEKEKQNFFYGFYILSMTIAFYVNYLTFGLLVIFTLIVLWYRERLSLPKWVVSNVLVLLLSAPLLPILFDQFSAAQRSLVTALLAKGVPTLFSSLGVFFFALPLIFLIIIISLLVVFRDSLKSRFSRYTISNSIFLSFLLLFGVSYMYLATHSLSLFGIPLFRVPITQSYFLIRHSFFLVPFFYLFLATKIAALSSRKINTVALLFLIFVNIFALTYYYIEPTKAEWQEATENIARGPMAEPLILLDRGGNSGEFLLSYYLENYDFIRLTWSDGKGWYQSANETLLLDALEERETFWLLLARNRRSIEDYDALFLHEFQREEEQSFQGISLYYYERLVDLSNEVHKESN